MEVRGIHHLGVAVTDLDEAMEVYGRLFGARLEHRERIPDQGVEVASLRVGAGRVELLASLGPETPVVCVATEESVLPKLLSNLAEVRARGAKVFAVASEGSPQVAEYAEDVVYIPRTDALLQVILGIVPLQLLAYHVARARSLNVDQPRNLAKTVTVE